MTLFYGTEWVIKKKCQHVVEEASKFVHVFSSGVMGFCFTLCRFGVQIFSRWSKKNMCVVIGCSFLLIALFFFHFSCLYCNLCFLFETGQSLIWYTCYYLGEEQWRGRTEEERHDPWAWLVRELRREQCKNDFLSPEWIFFCSSKCMGLLTILEERCNLISLFQMLLQYINYRNLIPLLFMCSSCEPNGPYMDGLPPSVKWAQHWPPRVR
jgi:hypothetical protein